MLQESFPIPERFLRQLWKHQHFKKLSLTTTDGRPITVFSSGTVNVDAGPDFVDALIKIGTITYRGDVELHQTLAEWQQHAHDTDPKYNRVVLHVVFKTESVHLPSLTKSKRAIPVLVLAPYLSGPLRDVWQKMILDERSERLRHIKCFSRNTNAPSPLIHSWMRKLAGERMEFKVQRFEERLKDLVEREQRRIREPLVRYGTIPFGLNPDEIPTPTRSFARRDFTNVHLWEQLLYEGALEALGYAKNREPFLRLAQNIPLERIRTMIENDSTERRGVVTEALLFGAAGLLNVKAGDAESRRYIKELKSTWKNLQPRYRGEVLHQADWQFFRLRPENFPTVRLAGAAQLILRMLEKDFFKTIIQIVKSRGTAAKEKIRSLEGMFIIPTHDFRPSHDRPRKKTQAAIPRPIGKNRADDIIINVVIPICLLYARIFKEGNIRQAALEIFKECSPLNENTVTRTMETQLIKGKFSLNSAMLQQGALQLYKFYCVEERCAECAVGKVVFPT